MSKYKRYFSAIIAPVIAILGYGYLIMLNGHVNTTSGLRIFMNGGAKSLLRFGSRKCGLLLVKYE